MIGQLGFFVQLAVGSQIASIQVSIVDKMMVTNNVDLPGFSSTFYVDIDTADTIVPICTPGTASDCYNPDNSKSFEYCLSSKQCFDRQLPPFICNQTTPIWDPTSAVFTDHIVTLFGSDIRLSTFEFTEKELQLGGLILKTIPLKGAINYGKGILGIGPSRRSCRSETLLTKSNAQYLQFKSDSIALYDSVPENVIFTDTLQLSATNSSLFEGKYAFNVFHPTVCGIDLLGSVSSHWAAVIDSSFECLVLPEFLFNSLSTWKAGSDGTLYFFLSQNKTGMSIALNLTNVCIQSRPADLREKDISVTALRPIIFGSSALLSLNGLGFEILGLNRVGFSSLSPTSSKCTTVVPTCIGNQVYDPILNECMHPICSPFLLSRYDSSQGVCEWEPYVSLIVYTCITALVFGELLVFTLRNRAVSLAKTTCESNQIVSS